MQPLHETVAAEYESFAFFDVLIFWWIIHLRREGYSFCFVTPFSVFVIIYINRNTYTRARKDARTRTQAQVQLHFSSIFHKYCNQYFKCDTKVKRQAGKFAIFDLWISMAFDHLSLFVSCERKKFLFVACQNAASSPNRVTHAKFKTTVNTRTHTHNTHTHTNVHRIVLVVFTSQERGPWI